MNDGPVKIEVFAVLCAKCKRMELVVHAASEELPDIEVDIVKNQDLISLRERGVMANPALIIDGEIVAQGTVPSVEETKRLIIKAHEKRMKRGRSD